MTRAQYVEVLIDAFLADADLLVQGFGRWCDHQVPRWQGRSEVWRRERIALASATRSLYASLRKEATDLYTLRDVLRSAYLSSPELYDLALVCDPKVLEYRGDSGDLHRRHALRMEAYEADRQSHLAYLFWNNLAYCAFEEAQNVAVIRDLSTVEELETSIQMSRFLSLLFAERPALSQDAISDRITRQGELLRATFLAEHDYLPEDSCIPYTPVTIAGPQDHLSYFAAHFPEMAL